MIKNHDIEKIIVVNKEQAEIYLKKEALESGRYPKLPKPGTGFGLTLPKPNFTYNIGDISSFELISKGSEKMLVMHDKDLIYPDYQTRKNWFGDILSWLLLPVLLIGFLAVYDETNVRRRSRRSRRYFQCWQITGPDIR
jgi:AFG3 family protein